MPGAGRAPRQLSPRPVHADLGCSRRQRTVRRGVATPAGHCRRSRAGAASRTVRGDGARGQVEGAPAAPHHRDRAELRHPGGGAHRPPERAREYLGQPGEEPDLGAEPRLRELDNARRRRPSTPASSSASRVSCRRASPVVWSTTPGITRAFSVQTFHIYGSPASEIALKAIDYLPSVQVLEHLGGEQHLGRRRWCGRLRHVPRHRARDARRHRHPLHRLRQQHLAVRRFVAERAAVQ